MKERILEGSYCPLCGAMGLRIAARDGMEVAYCGPSVKEAHTVIVIRELKPPKSEEE
jgi:hypothetical protein